MSDAKKAIKYMLLWIMTIALCNLARMGEILWFPLPKTLFSTFYFPVLSLFLIHYFSTRIVERSRLKFWLVSVAWLIFAFSCLKEIKYNTFYLQEWVGRYLWYFYYIPVLAIPLCSFNGALMINSKDKNHIPKQWYWVSVVTLAIIALLLTNDIHQQVFSFSENFYQWETNYSRGWGFIVIWVWQYLLYIFTLVAMLHQSRLTDSKKYAWIPVIPLILGGILMLAQIMGFKFQFHSQTLLGFQEIVSFSNALFWIGCIQIGLIPTNDNYEKLMKRLSLPVWILSENQDVIYQSKNDLVLPEDYNILSENAYLTPDIILHSSKIPGGYGLWQEDIAEINLVKDKLQELQEHLQEESVLIQLDNKRKEDQARINEQNQIYDRIAEMTAPQLNLIHTLAKEAETSSNPGSIAHLICFYGAYIKRISNLMLLENKEADTDIGELYLSIGESFRYLEKTGIHCVLGEAVSEIFPTNSLISSYYIFEKILEDNLDTLSGVYATFQNNDGLTLRIVLDGGNSEPGQNLVSYAEKRGLKLSWITEDSLFIKIIFMKGGDNV